MRTCVHHGDSVDEGWYRCDRGRVPACYQLAKGPYAPCFVPLPAAAEEPDPVPDSTPVTFAAILAYHRQRADDWRSADRPWHEEAVECLRELADVASMACETCGAAPYDGPARFEGSGCHKADCPIWQARKAVEVDHG